jgi:hypothetical protein
MTDKVAAVVDDTSYSRVYDYFKHLTTVSLISIGGVLGLLTGNVDGISAQVVIPVIVMLGIAGFLSIMTMCGISAMVMLRRPHEAKTAKQLLVLQYAATFFLIIGLGWFVGAFAKIVV